MGAEPALALILSGDAIDGTRAAALGLVDRLAAGDLLPEAIAFARRYLGHFPSRFTVPQSV